MGQPTQYGQAGLGASRPLASSVRLCSADLPGLQEVQGVLAAGGHQVRLHLADGSGRAMLWDSEFQPTVGSTGRGPASSIGAGQPWKGSSLPGPRWPHLETGLAPVAASCWALYL